VTREDSDNRAETGPGPLVRSPGKPTWEYDVNAARAEAGRPPPSLQARNCRFMTNDAAARSTSIQTNQQWQECCRCTGGAGLAQQIWNVFAGGRCAGWCRRASSISLIRDDRGKRIRRRVGLPGWPATIAGAGHRSSGPARAGTSAYQNGDAVTCPARPLSTRNAAASATGTVPVTLSLPGAV